MAPISNEQFLMAVIKSMEGKINFKDVAKETGLKENAARMRWTRYKEKLNASTTASAASDADNDSDEDPAGGSEAPKKPAKKRASKKMTAKEEVKKPAKKTRKVSEEGDADDEAAQIKEEDE